MEQILKIVSMISVIAGIFWAIYVFGKQQRFKRIQNLSSIWEKFIQDEKNGLMDLFTLCDQIIDNPDEALRKNNLEKLAGFRHQDKLRFLGLLEEVAMYVEIDEVDKKYAHYLFQWHFYFVFVNTDTSREFWHNIGGVEESLKPYWFKSKQFSELCKKPG